MAHLTSASVAAVISQTAHTMSASSYTTAHSAHVDPVAQMNITDGDPSYQAEPPTWDQFLDPCWGYRTENADDKKKALKFIMNPSVSPPNLQDAVQKPPHDASGQWNKCHLLSLPKEIRLKIWTYILTDPSKPNLLVGIDRKPFSPYYKHIKPPTPHLRFFHAEHREPVSISLLLANHAVYEEALPVLYESVRFMPSDHGGLLPLFLEMLSPYARSCIRNIYLCFPKQLPSDDLRRDRAKRLFHWAVTCAQVARLNDTLTQIEVDGDWSVFEKTANRRGLLFPLCKIKAEKVFVPCGPGDNDAQDHNAAFQQLLVEAEQALKASATLREERTKAEAVERAERDKIWTGIKKQEEDTCTRDYNNEWALERSHFNSRSRLKVPFEETWADPTWRPINVMEGASTNNNWHRSQVDYVKRMEENLSTVPGIAQFEKELEAHATAQSPTQSGLPEYKIDDDGTGEDWDIVSVRSGASTPKARPVSVMSKYSDETWPDTASTLVGRDEVDKHRVVKEEDSDTKSEGWECVEE
jgi:hypothetical protein